MSSFGVVIPAYNESRVIGRCIRAVIDSAAPSMIDIVVVCNGCNDNTSDEARIVGATFVQVIETDIVSKTHALNEGDLRLAAFPRFYVDADVVLQANAVHKLAAALEQPGILAASPRVRYDLSQCSWAVRAFYAIAGILPSNDEPIGGSGVYALSEAGWRRIGKFPPIVADDEFVRRHFSSRERITVADALAVVTPPRGLWGLISVNTRSHYGNYQLAESFPHLTPNKAASNRSALRRLVMRVDLWPPLAVYIFVKVVARVRAKRKLRSHTPYLWERDESSREISLPVQA